LVASDERVNKNEKEKLMAEDWRSPIIIYPAEEGGYVAEVPALKGCLAQGETQAECLSELNTVQTLWIESARHNHREIPKPSEALDNLFNRLES
jgi:predicted RNase H-like HicB family nuclease